MQVVKKGRIPILIWADEVEEGAMQQAENLSNLPFAYRQIALMPDVHQGYGMPIGGVLATEGYIIPNAMGVDIGCGLTAVKTDVKGISEKTITQVLKRAKSTIPVGFKHHKFPQEWSGFERVPQVQVIKAELKSAAFQLGTLGGGNHFLSIEQGDDGHIWLMLHSGSRNLGYKVATYFNKVAKKNNTKVPKSFDLAPLHIASQEGKEYYEAMSFCLAFAEENREKLFAAFFAAFSEAVGSPTVLKKIKVHHNYASVETHFGKDLIIHRKGANRAQKGEVGIVPGSMGTPSYIVEGLGNKESFESCSHGAGRVMGRKEANRVLSVELANKAMDGIVFPGWKGDLSESPLCYKDIETVMSQQKDLVKPLVKLTPLGVMKG